MLSFKQFLSEKNEQLKTFYCKRDVLNGEDIVAWAKEKGLSSIITPDQMHVTVAFSKKKIDWATLNQELSSLKVKNEGRSIEHFDGGATVLRISSPELTKRWKHFIDVCGASYDFNEYKPHITLTYDDVKTPNDLDPPFQGEIKLGPEVFDIVDLDYKETVKEI